jgi:hypothetical protein
MKTVRVVGSDVNYPSTCACCLKPATKTLQIRKEDLKRLALAAVVGVAASSTGSPSSLAGRLRDSRAVEVPYCRACMDHVRWSRLGGFVGVVLSAFVYSFFGAMFGGLLYTMLSISAEDPEAVPSPWVVVAPCVAAALGLALAQIRLRPAGALDRRHSAGGRDAVAIVRFSSDSITLKCENNDFAAALVAANPGSSYAGRP